MTSCHYSDGVTLHGKGEIIWVVQSNPTSPLKAESFLQLAAEKEVREIGSVRRTRCPVASFEDGGGRRIERAWLTASKQGGTSGIQSQRSGFCRQCE